MACYINKYFKPIWAAFGRIKEKCTIYATAFLLICRIAADQWFSPGTPISSTNKTDRHDITEILLKVALNTINLYSHTNLP